MEDLAALEEQVENVSAGRFAAAPAEEALTPMRATCLRSPCDAGGGHAKDEEDDDDKDQACNGCLRSREHGVDLMEPSKKLEWAWKNRKGLWCKDCNTAWRLLHQGSLTLALFAKSLQNESSRRQQWAK
jgi:hypothetical protein